MRESDQQPAHVISPSRGRASAPSRFEWRVVEIPRDVTRSEVRALVTEQAEYGRWELKRSQILVGGARRVWLRRRVMRVQRSDAA
ncbi:DUF5703 family protein [uncultured Demequina sp.]|uniref:DUF5703 family protein n=1 Tax=uncultured Demequina sp. TaxID=693499 RepID=UPI0025DF9C73|nr:DUF5703 family protein [uncultured Demequina sp.]